MPDQPHGRGPAGSLDSLNALFVAGRPRLLAFVLGLVRDRQAAEEIVQEVWIRLAAAAGRGGDLREPERWFRGVARNLVLHHFRARRSAKVVADSQMLRIVELVGLAFDERAAAEADDPWVARRDRLAACVEQLPEHSRQILRMKYTHGLKAAQIAHRLGRTEDAIMKALSRIRQLLARCTDENA